MVIAIKNNKKKQNDDKEIKALAIKIFNRWAQIVNGTKPYYEGSLRDGGSSGKQDKFTRRGN